MYKIGLLPLYLELYDDTCAYMRPRIEKFRDVIIGELEKRGLQLVSAPICRVRSEFESAVNTLTDEGVSAIVTLHLSYSPSLECIDSLADSKIPLIVLDTTESYAFDESVGSDEILYNHGIHGVQDMCNLLRRRKKAFEIFVGHYLKSAVLDRVVRYCRGTQIASAFTGSRVGVVGKPFHGMGDFYVPFSELKARFGLEVITYDNVEGRKRIAGIDSLEIRTERIEDRDSFVCDTSITDELYERTAKVNLAIRKRIEEENLSAFSINFLET